MVQTEETRLKRRSPSTQDTSRKKTCRLSRNTILSSTIPSLVSVPPPFRVTEASICYLYDVVVNGLFQLQALNGGLQLRLDVPAQHRDANQALRRELIQNELNPEEERLLTSSLFFSMLPLHRRPLASSLLSSLFIVSIATVV